jgi:hypothetical protein
LTTLRDSSPPPAVFVGRWHALTFEQKEASGTSWCSIRVLTKSQASGGSARDSGAEIK